MRKNFKEGENNNLSSTAYYKEKSKLESKFLLEIPLWFILTVIIVLGLLVLYSVSAPTAYANYGDPTYYVKKQFVFTIMGVVLAFIISRININFYKKPFIMVGILLLSLALLLLTMVVGVTRNNARRWLNIGFEFQTSELFKLSVVLCIASYRNLIIHLRQKGKIKLKPRIERIFGNSLFDFIIPVGVLVVIDLIVLMQPHFSAFGIIGVLVFVCMLASGLSLVTWIRGVLPYILVAVLLFVVIMSLPQSVPIKQKATHYIEKNFEHVFNRFDIYKEDENLSSDDTLQVDNAHNALGSGGINGVGFGNSRAKYHYVPEAHNDYIFSIFIEETGMIGGTLLILLYVILFSFCMMVVRRSKDIFARIVSVGYTFMLMLEAMMNIAINLKVMPSTGVSLPFISYGGTAQIIFLVAYGMIICVARTGTTSKYDDLVSDSNVNAT